ncbi:hypothetical protein Tco_1500246 [Tanacetum coccineum]
MCAFQLRSAVAIFLLLEPLLSFLVLDLQLVFAAGSFLFMEVGVASAVNEGDHICDRHDSGRWKSKALGKKQLFRDLFHHYLVEPLGDKYDLVRSISTRLPEDSPFNLIPWMGLDSKLEKFQGVKLHVDPVLRLQRGWDRVPYATKIEADVELKDNIIVDMPKITGEGHYICNIRVEYEWKPPRCVSCMVFGHIHKECPKNTGACEKKTVKSLVKLLEKFEELLTSGQDILVDEAGNPLKKVEFLGDYDSKDEVASVDNDMARSMASERVGFGTQSLLEQLTLVSKWITRIPIDLKANLKFLG